MNFNTDGYKNNFPLFEVVFTFIMNFSLLFSPYCAVSILSIPDCSCGCYISFLLNNQHIRNTQIYSCLFGSGVFQYHC